MDDIPKTATGTVSSIVNTSKKSGTANRNGKDFNWNIMTVNIKTENGKTEVADSFDDLKVGDKVSMTFDSQHNSVNAKFYKPNPTEEMLHAIYNMVRDLLEKVDKLSVQNPDEPADEPLITDVDEPLDLQDIDF